MRLFRKSPQTDRPALASPAEPASRPAFTALVSGAHLANDVVTSMLPALLPSLATHFDLGPAEVALLASAFALSSSLPQPFFGWLADRFGGHRLGALGLAMTATLVLSLSFVPSVAWLGALVMIGGFGSAALHPAGAGLSRTAAGKNAGLGVALFDAAGMAGGATGPLLAIGLTASLGLGGLAWAAVPALLIASVLWWLAPGAKAASPRTSPPPLSLNLLRGGVGRVALVALCVNIAVLTFSSATPIWLVTAHGLAADSPIIGWTLATFTSSAAVGGLLGGTLSRKLDPSRLVVTSLTLSALPLQGILLSQPGSVAYFVSVGLAGGLVYLQAPLLLVRAQELAPGASSAIAGLLLGGTTAAAALVYAATAALHGRFGMGATMTAAFLLVLPAARLASKVLAPVRTSQRDHVCGLAACAA